MKKTQPSSIRRRWPLLVLGSASVVGGIWGGLRLQGIVRDQLPGFLTTRLEAALGHPVRFGAVHVWPTGAVVEDFRVLRVGGESVDPVSARRLRLSADWWTLLTTGRLHVSGVELETAQVRLSSPKGAGGGQPWTAQLASLSGSGVDRLGLRDASIRLLAADGVTAVWAAEDLRGDLTFQPGRFRYSANLRQFASQGTSFSRVRLSGSGNAAGVRVQDLQAGYQGGQLQASGSLKAAGNAALLTIRAQRLPLARLAGQIGIPARWAMQGRVSGTVTVDARDNSLRAVQGTLQVERGSFTRDGGRFPWRAAAARVDWTPARATWSDVRIAGEGVQLTASGNVTTEPGRPFPSGRFQVSGEVSAERPAAVKQVAELLAFDRTLDGRWQAGGASVRFTAQGQVGDLAQATASGRLRLDGLQLRPTAASDTMTVARLEADVERTPERLALRNVSARTDGFALSGAAILTADRPGRPAQVQAEGRADVADLKSLRKAIPQSSLWKWMPVVSPEASGSLAFRVAGSPASAASWRSDGRFEVKEFRLGAHSPLPSGAVFFIPVHTARGEFRHEGGALRLTGLELDAHTFDAKGHADFRFDVAEPTVNLALHLNTDDWRSLPAMPADALPEVVGGCLEADVSLAGPVAKLAEAPVEGRFRLTHAAYRPTLAGAALIPVEALAARFRWADRALELPEVSVVSPLLTADARGRIYPEAGDYRLALDVDARTMDAAALAARFTEEARLAGGAAQVRLRADAPVTHLADGRVTGSLELKDAEVLSLANVSWEMLGRERLEARKLSLDFQGGDGEWSLTRLALDVPGLEVAMDGLVSAARMDAVVKLTSDRWSAPSSLPVAGGAVAFSGRLQGDPSRSESLLFAGNGEGDGARLRYAGPQAMLEGGSLKLAARGEGPVHDLARWVRSGDFTLAGGQVTVAGRPAQPVETVSAHLARDGDRLRISNARATLAGVRVAGGGEWTPAGHSLKLTVDADDLARFGISLPKGLSTGKHHLTASLSGTAQRPVQTAEGRLALEGVRIAAGALWAGQPAQAVEQLAGRFQYAGDRLHVDGMEARSPLGALTASGEWSKDGHRLALSLQGDDFSRLGLALPAGFAVKGYHVDAAFSGTAAQPFSRSTGTLSLTGAVVPFGPGAPQRLESVTARFAQAGSRVELSDLVATGRVGRLAGGGVLSPDGFRLALEGRELDPGLAAWMLPGVLEGGRLAGDLRLEGGAGGVLRTASGRFELTNAEYRTPSSLELLGGPVKVSRLGGDYRWTPGGSTLSALTLESDLLRGQGELSVGNDGGRLQANLTSSDLGRVVDFWPALAGRLRGGVGAGALDARFNAGGVRGTLALTDTGGALLVPGAPAEYAEHPLSTASLILGFAPDRLTFTDVKLRGPKGNLDGEGVWSASGPVSGTGKAWFASDYTKRLIKPSGWGWLAKAAGIREVRSDFTLDGTADRVTLKAGITKSVLWKLAKGRVPKEFQAVAAGKSPLWVKPLEVTQQPAVATTRP